MNIFESLENLNVSEECFNDIMGIVEEILNETGLPDDKFSRAFKKAIDITAKPGEMIINAVKKNFTPKDKLKKTDVSKVQDKLRVSEECFNDILDRVEENLYDVVGRAEKKGIVSPEKAGSLKEKGLQISSKERLASQNRDFASKGIDKYEARERMEAKRDRANNKTYDNLNTPESLCERIKRIVEKHLNFDDVKFVDNPPQPTKAHDVPMDTPVKERPDAAAYHIKNTLDNGKRKVHVGIGIKNNKPTETQK